MVAGTPYRAMETLLDQLVATEHKRNRLEKEIKRLSRALIGCHDAGIRLGLRNDALVQAGWALRDYTAHLATCAVQPRPGADSDPAATCDCGYARVFNAWQTLAATADDE